jgi:hypothetical protein
MGGGGSVSSNRWFANPLPPKTTMELSYPKYAAQKRLPEGLLPQENAPPPVPHRQ